MEVESLELTVEDVLRLHRGWITKLFVDDRKNDVEIVELLYERHLLVTPAHIRKCIQDWDLLTTHSPSPRPNLESEPNVDLLSTQSPPPRPNLELEPNVDNLFTPTSPELHIDSHSVSDGWELVNPDSNTPSAQLSITSNLHFLPNSPTYNPSPLTTECDNPEAINLYDQLPTSSKHKRKSSNSLDRPAKDKLKLTCYHGDEFHPVEMTLGIFKQGPSPIETYASDDQSHERIAVGLERDPDHSAEFPICKHRRAGEWAGIGGHSRMVKGETRNVRKNKPEKKDR